MKLKYLILATLFAATLFVSCTPENVNDGQTDQQVDKGQIVAPQNG